MNKTSGFQVQTQEAQSQSKPEYEPETQSLTGNKGQIFTPVQKTKKGSKLDTLT